MYRPKHQTDRHPNNVRAEIFGERGALGLFRASYVPRHAAPPRGDKTDTPRRPAAPPDPPPWASPAGEDRFA